MTPLTLLKKADINPDKPVLLITTIVVIENLWEAIEKYCPDLKIDKMTKEDLLTLVNSYGSCVINHSPGNYRQERAALLQNFEMLRRYGLTDEDYQYIDFC